MISGPQLREFREASDVRQSEVAHAVGWPRQRIGEIEQAKSVTLDTAETYVNAVEKVRAPRLGREPRTYALRVVLYLESKSHPGFLSGPLGGLSDNPLISGRGDGKVSPW